MVSEDPETQALDEVAKLLAVLIRLQCETQNEAIIELGRVGISPSRIGTLLGTSGATARTTLNRAKKADAK